MAPQHNDSSSETRRASSRPTSMPQQTFVTYIAIIDDIIARSDMDRASEKQIRQTLEKRLGIDLMSQKATIKKLIPQRFDVFDVCRQRAQSPISLEGSTPTGFGNQYAPSQLPSGSAPISRLPPEMLYVILEYVDILEYNDDMRFSTLARAYIAEAPGIVHPGCGPAGSPRSSRNDLPLVQAKNVCQTWHKVALNIVLGMDTDNLTAQQRRQEDDKLAHLRRHLLGCVVRKLPEWPSAQ